MNKNNNLHQLDGRVSIGTAIPFGLQHVLAMFVSNVTPIIILANIIGIGDISASLVQNAMIVAGIGTLVQLYPVWRVGSRLPIVMGVSFTFLSVSIAIGSRAGYGTLIGSVIVGGLAEGILGLFAKYWIKTIRPIVAATVVTGIGFSLLPIGAYSFAGGVGAADFGSAQNWVVGSITLLTCLGCMIFAKGYIKMLSVLIALIVGYIAALCFGMVDLSSFQNVGIVSFPKLLPAMPEFRIGPILSIIAIYLVSATETIGDTSALTSSALNRDITEKELSGSIACDGFISTISGLFGCTPITSYSQNVGLASMTKVVNRFAIACGAVIMIIAGIFPAVGILLTSVPQCVLGGCTIMMFGSILFAGFKMIAQCGFSTRNMIIVSLSLSIGLGFTQVSAMFHIFPEIARSIISENIVALVFILSLVLDIIIPKDLED